MLSPTLQRINAGTKISFGIVNSCRRIMELKLSGSIWNAGMEKASQMGVGLTSKRKRTRLVSYQVTKKEGKKIQKLRKSFKTAIWDQIFFEVSRRFRSQKN